VSMTTAQPSTSPLSSIPPARPPRNPDGSRLSSVASSIRLLKAFSEEQVEIGISDLAKRLGVAKSTVHRLAVTLVADGMLEQNPDTGKYRLGLSLFRLGSLVRQRMNVSNEGRS
jgi:IclR family KDG regulon transcriptional repressor